MEFSNEVHAGLFRGSKGACRVIVLSKPGSFIGSRGRLWEVCYSASFVTAVTTDSMQARQGDSEIFCEKGLLTRGSIGRIPAC